ncbi:ATP-binding protein [Candidatus Bathyarchaeota archaeon]|nr:ATP-binding protein [Candidatus Bathyarchaeota archaeon]
MYFDPLPKRKKIDLFNRESELAQFSDALTYSSLIVIVGLRRTGKTSFMNVALSGSKHPHIVLDMRGLSYNPSHAELVRKIESAFNLINKRWLSMILDTIKQVKGVSVPGASISLDWSKEGVDLTSLFDKVNAWAEANDERFLVAFDEIQLIRGDKGIPRLFAHIIDYNQNICLVVTGSEMGLLFDFLGFDDTESPLYGRHYTEIRMRNFERDESERFLKAGFQQIGVTPRQGVIEYAVESLDGVVGWLTLFGTRCRDHKDSSSEIVDAVVMEGGKLARAEALKIVKYSPRYAVVLNHLAKAKKATWSQIKSILEARENRALPSPSVSDILNKLVKTGLVEKDGEYSIPDRLLEKGILESPLPED